MVLFENGSLVVNFFLVYDFFTSEFWSSPRQMDRKRLLLVYRALAQVGSINQSSTRVVPQVSMSDRTGMTDSVVTSANTWILCNTASHSVPHLYTCIFPSFPLLCHCFFCSPTVGPTAMIFSIFFFLGGGVPLDCPN